MDTKALVPRTSFVPEVVDEEGQPVAGPELEAVTQLVTQMAQVAQLARIRKSLERQEAQMEKVSQGRMRPFEKTIEGDTVTRWEVIDDVGQLCSSATVLNDGPDDCYVCLRDLRDGFQRISEGESLDFSFKHPVIERFFFKSTTGGTANLRIPLEY